MLTAGRLAQIMHGLDPDAPVIVGIINGEPPAPGPSPPAAPLSALPAA